MNKIVPIWYEHSHFHVEILILKTLEHIFGKKKEKKESKKRKKKKEQMYQNSRVDYDIKNIYK